MLTVKCFSNACKIFNILQLVIRVYKNEQTSAIIQEISVSNLETGRYSPKSGVSHIIQESYSTD